MVLKTTCTLIRGFTELCWIHELHTRRGWPLTGLFGASEVSGVNNTGRIPPVGSILGSCLTHSSDWLSSSVCRTHLMHPHLFLHVFLLCHGAGISGQYPLVQNVTVTEGGTANLTCRVEYNDNTSLQWSNPAQQTLFFGDKKGEFQIDRLQQPYDRWSIQSIPCVRFVAVEKCTKPIFFIIIFLSWRAT